MLPGSAATRDVPQLQVGSSSSSEGSAPLCPGVYLQEGLLGGNVGLRVTSRGAGEGGQDPCSSSGLAGAGAALQEVAAPRAEGRESPWQAEGGSRARSGGEGGGRHSRGQVGVKLDERMKTLNMRERKSASLQLQRSAPAPVCP